MSESFIEVVSQDGGRFNAYIARPAQGSGPELVLLQEIFGVNDYLKGMADRYAEEGYVVVVPDLFWRMKPGIQLGYGEADMKQALGYLERFDIDRAVDDIAATMAALRALPEQAGKIGGHFNGLFGFWRFLLIRFNFFFINAHRLFNKVDQVGIGWQIKQTGYFTQAAGRWFGFL